MSLGSSLYDARKKSGMSQQEVAERLGVSRQTISKWELDDLQKRYGYDELNALLVLKDILASVWKTGKKQSKRKNKHG